MNLISNGGFESNTGAGTSGFTGWSVATEGGSSGNWFAVQTTTPGNTSLPLNAFTVPDASQGSFAAITDSTGPASLALLQTFTVAGPGTVTLSFNYFRLNVAQDYYPSADLDYNDLNNTGQPNQEARVDILSAGAGAFDTGATDLATVFQTNSGDPLMDSGYQTVNMDLTSLVGAGGTFQLRFAEVNDLAQFSFGIDNVAIDYTPAASAVPEPGSLFPALLLGGLVGFAAVLRRASFCKH